MHAPRRCAEAPAVFGSLKALILLGKLMPRLPVVLVFRTYRPSIALLGRVRHTDPHNRAVLVGAGAIA